MINFPMAGPTCLEKLLKTSENEGSILCDNTPSYSINRQKENEN